MRRFTAIFAILVLSFVGSAFGQTFGAAGMPANYCSVCTTMDRTLSSFVSDFNNAGPGQTVCFNPGTNVTSSTTISLTASGAPGSLLRGCMLGGYRITFTASVPGIEFSGSHILLAGWTLVGNHTGNGKGIQASNSGWTDVTLAYNTVHDFGADGLGINGGDCLQIIWNKSYNNAATFPSCGSGISVWEPILNRECTAQWHIVIANNLSFDNSNPSGGTDGNGIIFDDFRCTQHGDGCMGAYAGTALAYNNIVYGNFGAGLKAYEVPSDRVTFVNNILFRNQTGNWSGWWRGEISNEHSGAITYANNVIVYDTGLNSKNSCTLDWRSGRPLSGGNFCFNFASGSSQPYFRNPPRDFATKAASPAINGGVSSVSGHRIYVPATDLLGRKLGSNFDSGAYQSELAPAAGNLRAPPVKNWRARSPQ
jgi:hypothetical protein